MTYNIWSNNHVGITEEVLDTDFGYYIGLKTATKYPKTEFYVSEYFNAKIVGVDKVNNTGMYHLDKYWNNIEYNNYNNKIVYIGAIVSVRKHFKNGGIQVYYCKELNEYFSEYEIEVIK